MTEFKESIDCYCQSKSQKVREQSTCMDGVIAIMEMAVAFARYKDNLKNFSLLIQSSVSLPIYTNASHALRHESQNQP